ncbi:MAG: hypothetical protein DSY46_03690 [Hydrogenimonas sp.]|nr:MAG: hypothetical protein DSY46_03690 [Hydrogenimonas sp.]
MKSTPTILGSCPSCGENIVHRGEFYGCEGFRDGCDFTVSIHALATIGHYTISPKQMRKLLKGPTQMYFKMSNGVERIFTVKLKNVNGKWRPWIDFEAGSELEVLGSCPCCGANVVETPLSYGCSRWEDGCEFAIFKNAIKRFGGKMLSKQDAKRLLSQGVIEVIIRTFNQQERKVNLYIDNEFGCKIDFEGDTA